jgi:hypothetical protein
MVAKHSFSPHQAFSRRDFLKVGAASLFGLLLPPKLGRLPRTPWSAGFGDLIPDQLGRVLDPNISIFDTPSFSGKLKQIYWRDNLLPITDVTVGDEEPAHNRVWYQIGNQGYAHSGSIQPVRTIVNEPVMSIPESGALAEVTVPYTDARWDVGDDQLVAYRFYYETVYWVTGVSTDRYGQVWYTAPDDKWDYDYYVPARHLRIIPPEEMAPLSPDVAPEDKRIEVHTAEQVIIAYEKDRPIFMARTATGAKFSNGDFATPPGRHYTFHKRPTRHMAAGDIASNGYDLPGVPWISYITESGIAFHGTYWHNNYGRPRSHGCINLTPQAAKWVFLWTLPTVPFGEEYGYDEFHGTPVDVISETSEE